MPHVLREEVAVEVPQVQTAEMYREDAVTQIKEVVKQIPRTVIFIVVRYLMMGGNLRPLLNGEILKNWPNGEKLGQRR